VILPTRTGWAAGGGIESGFGNDLSARVSAVDRGDEAFRFTATQRRPIGFTGGGGVLGVPLGISLDRGKDGHHRSSAARRKLRVQLNSKPAWGAAVNVRLSRSAD
jgi:hypothetical protein